MADHDTGYKRLFSHREMVADLLDGFVREPWVRELEFDTLERVSGSYVSDDFREREDDIIWRVHWRDRWLYVYLLLVNLNTCRRLEPCWLNALENGQNSGERKADRKGRPSC